MKIKAEEKAETIHLLSITNSMRESIGKVSISLPGFYGSKMQGKYNTESHEDTGEA